MSLKRVQPAERLYRTTGLGRYVHSKKLGIDMTCTVDHSHNAIDFEYPVGCDRVLTAVLDQKRYWFWGDTQAIHYPLGGSFHMTGATTDVAYPNVDTQPPVYDFFRDLARSIFLLQPDDPSCVWDRSGQNPLFRGDLHNDVFRESESNSTIRLQPDSLSIRSGFTGITLECNRGNFPSSLGEYCRNTLSKMVS